MSNMDYMDNIKDSDWKTLMEMLRHATAVQRDHDREISFEVIDAEREAQRLSRFEDERLLRYWDEMIASVAKDMHYFDNAAILNGDIMNYDKIPTENTTYNDMIAIKRQRGNHWQTKTEAESTLYYTRLCDGNYRRIGESPDLPESFRGSLLTNMAMDYNRLIKQIHGEDAHKRMFITENELPDYIQCDTFLELKNSIKEMAEKVVKNTMSKATEAKELTTVTAEDMQNVGKLIDRRTNRLEREAADYRERYYKERKAKEDLLIENRVLKEEIAHLKRTGRFPVDTDIPKEASAREKRFLSIDV